MLWVFLKLCKKPQILEWWQSAYVRLISCALLLLKFRAAPGLSWYSCENLSFVKILWRTCILAGSFCCVSGKGLFPWFVICDRIHYIFLWDVKLLSKRSFKTTVGSIKILIRLSLCSSPADCNCNTTSGSYKHLNTHAVQSLHRF